MDSYKIVQILKVILLFATTLICDLTLGLPYWYQFTVQISWDAGRTMQDKVIDVGLYYMAPNSNLEMTDTIFIEKSSNSKTFPPMYKLAQIFFGLGFSAFDLLTCVSIIYCCRKYRSATGELCLAAGLLPSSLCLLLGVIFAALVTVTDNSGYWESFPVRDNYMQVQANPQISMSYAMYGAAFGALLGLITLVVAWIQACMMCKHVENVRYQMLNAPLTDEERGAGPARTYSFEKPGGFRYDGYSKPGREVDF